VHECRAGGRTDPPAREIGSGVMADELFLIDGNSLAYRAFFALPE
jgi:5'-3' exonuclease